MASKKRGTSPKISVPREDVPIENADLAESEDDLHVIDPSILGQAVVFGTDWTAATLIDQLRRGNIKLDPIFQRRDAWDSRAFFSIITLRRTNSGLYYRLPSTRRSTIILTISKRIMALRRRIFARYFFPSGLVMWI
jgi:hypothetical protein